MLAAVSGAAGQFRRLVGADPNVLLVTAVFARKSGCIALARGVVDVAGFGGGRRGVLLARPG